jgi:hypothetical protein
MDGIPFEKTETALKLLCYPAGKAGDEYYLPNNLTSIEAGAFSGCQNLKRVDLGKMTVIPYSAFSGCKSLEYIDLSNVTIVNSLAFGECTKLKRVTFGSGLLLIGDMAFTGSGLEEFIAPESLASIGYGAFTGDKSLKKVYIPEGSKCEIKAQAFFGDLGLEEFYIGSGDVVLESKSLGIGTPDFVLKLTVPKGYHIPDDAADDVTKLDITYIGERPYPYENILGVLVCLAVLFGIFKLFRRV